MAANTLLAIAAAAGRRGAAVLRSGVLIGLAVPRPAALAKPNGPSSLAHCAEIVRVRSKHPAGNEESVKAPDDKIPLYKTAGHGISNMSYQSCKAKRIFLVDSIDTLADLGPHQRWGSPVFRLFVAVLISLGLWLVLILAACQLIVDLRA
jgi:hypothetical protein